MIETLIATFITFFVFRSFFYFFGVDLLSCRVNAVAAPSQER